MKTVTLTELEFNKLLRYMESVSAIEAQSDLILEQLKRRVEEARKVRETYFQELTLKYPEIDPKLNYRAFEPEFQLIADAE